MISGSGRSTTFDYSSVVGGATLKGMRVDVEAL